MKHKQNFAQNAYKHSLITICHIFFIIDALHRKILSYNAETLFSQETCKK